MRVLVTGGAGFVGSHLCERLALDGHSVVVLDDLSTGSLENLRSLEGEVDFRLGSVTDRALVEELAQDVDAVAHLAAAVGVRLVIDRPLRTIETNVNGTQVLLDACVERRTPVLLASTSEVYGKSVQTPFRETDDLLLGPPDKTRWSYACSKALDECLAFAHAAENGIPVTVARLFNTVGPRQTGRYGMVLPTFVERALRGRPLTVHGSGLQTRCFAHVTDVAEALFGLLTHESARGEVFNVGSDQEISVRELARLVVESCDSSSEIALIPYDEAFGPGFEDVHRRVPDVSKLRRTLGFAPSTPVEDIVRDVVEDRQRARSTGAPAPTGRE